MRRVVIRFALAATMAAAMHASGLSHAAEPWLAADDPACPWAPADAPEQEAEEEECEEEEPEHVCYGPCPCCNPRKTLFQWSHCASFEGGPPGRDEPLATDRPDFTEASVTVGRGVAQLEMGYTYTHDRDGDITFRQHSYPETLLRVGVFAEWLELRITSNYLEEQLEGPFGRVGVRGAEDMTIGMKLALTPQEGVLPEMAMIVEMSLPNTGDPPFSNDEVLPGIVWLYGWDLTERLTLAGQSGMFRALDPVTGEPYGEIIQSITVGFSWTERLSSYTEFFAIMPDGADAALPESYFDGGFTFLVNNDLQLDMRAGVGLSENSDDYFVGTGIGIRF
jgi:hypothetical protein